MKPSFTRRYRRRSKPSKNEGAFFKKEGKTDTAFFGETSPGAFFQPGIANQAIQRKCASCEQEEKVQRQPEEKKEEDKKVQRVEDKKEEDKKLQREPEKKEEDKKLQKKEAGGSASATANVSTYIGSLHGKGNPLSPVTNQFFSSRIGYDFSQVRVHTDKEAAESAKSVNAKAYTVGNDIVFNEGQYNTESQEGKRLLAHELTHVVQQKGGKQEVDRAINHTKPTTQQQDPIPVALTPGRSSLGKTYLKINGQRVESRTAIMKPIWEAFEKATLQYDPQTKKCVIGLQDVNLTISADLIVLTDPVNDKWSGTYPGKLLDASTDCSKQGTVNVQLVSTPKGGAALQVQVAADENEHYEDILRLSKTHIEAFYDRLSTLSKDAANGNDCVKWFQEEVRDKNTKMVVSFADDWAAAVNKHDNKSSGTHNRNASTNVTDCKLITITVQL